MDLMETEKEKREEEVSNVPVGMGPSPSDALESEADLRDHSHDHDEEDHKVDDYSSFTKKQLVDAVKELSRETNFKRIDAILKEVKPLFDEIAEKERAAALDRFVASGESPDDFEYKGDDLDNAFDANLKLIRDKRAQFYRQQEDIKLSNLQRKQELLEKLRVLVDSPDNENQFSAFKALQQEWKTIGAVPGAQARTLWANYHALVDRFYDKQTIYFELKELDRKRNLESKLELCARAERLTEITVIREAIKELNELHHEFKHIGPVPIEDKEIVWQRFKAASDVVYKRRDTYLQDLQKELQANLEAKIKLCDEVIPFGTFSSDRIKEWNQKTKEILDIQKRWDGIGGLPRAKAKEVNKKFWSSFKHFFSSKNAFFKKLDEERSVNLEQKLELVKRAQELKESSDWESTSREMKTLQEKWKAIGPVPEKHREKVFQEFKDACDFFFNQRRGQQGKDEQDQVQNLQLKRALCDRLEQHVKDGTASEEVLREIQAQYNEIGFVPKRELAGLRTRYHELVNKFIGMIPALTDDDRSKLSLESELEELRSDPMAEQKLYHKEQAIRKRISKVENDLAVLKNNLEFFARSKSADKYREEFNEKIQETSQHLTQLKQQLRLLRTVS